MCIQKTGPELWSLWPTVVRNGPQDCGSQETSSVQPSYGATHFAFGAGTGIVPALSAWEQFFCHRVLPFCNGIGGLR